ncbi:hypothetical protein SAMN05444671_0320 [Flavobacterium sp. CF108]|uniref:hypothetical protein n=1 Tax=unclassified Flavobacterium TaxID=196869 RepID=UPI0008CCAD10|nr:MULTISPECIES: hypothetical protein [unclassified Flavobacterium]SEP21266.1 hypothetical protein SAMN04487978_0029 [Flavobacterium sp. fv08]SHI08804.1 hypothetical protein SAMN05444671_0320 [Flavobacterium sp. CF108]
MSLTLKTKIDAIKNVCPTIEDFLKKGFDQDYAEQISSDFSISIKPNAVFLENAVLLEQFNKNVNFKNFSFLGFTLKNHEDHKDFVSIGFRDSELLIVIKETNEIALLDEENFEIMNYISKDFESFLDLISILVSYDKVGFLGDSYTSEIKSETLNKVREILSDQKYFSFFSETIVGIK